MGRIENTGKSGRRRRIDSRKRKSVSRKRRLIAFESLESRRVLAAMTFDQPTTIGNDNDFGSDDVVFDAAITFVADSDAETPGEIVIETTGDITITSAAQLNGLGSSQAKLTLRAGGDILVSGSIGGDLLDVTLESLSTISLLSGSSIDLSDTTGDITLMAEDAPSAAESIAGDLLSPVLVTDRVATIEINNANLVADNITIQANAATQTRWEDVGNYMDDIGSQLFDTLASVSDLLISLISPLSGQVKIQKATGEVLLTDAVITSTGNVVIGAETEADASFTTVGVNTVYGAPFIASIGYGETLASANVEIGGATTITAFGDVDVTTNSVSTAEATSRASANTRLSGSDSVEFALSAALALTNEVSTISMDAGATIQSTAGHVTVEALGEVENKTRADSIVFQDGNLGLAIGVSVDNAEVTNEINGTIIASSPLQAPAFSFDATQVVSASSDSITLSQVPRTDRIVRGQELIYNADGNTAIPGLVDGQTYVVADVVEVDDDGTNLTLQVFLAETLPLELDALQVDSAATHTLGRLDLVTFGAANLAQNGSNQLVVNLASLADGDRVRYLGPNTETTIEGMDLTFTRRASGDTITRDDSGADWTDLGLFVGQTIHITDGDNDGASLTIASFSADGRTLVLQQANTVTAGSEVDITVGTTAGTAVGGLVQGQEYDVVLSGGSLVLTEVDNPASVLPFGGTGTGVQGFQVTRNLKSFSPASAVDNDRDTIMISGHGFQTGDVLVYHTDPTITITRDIYAFASDDLSTPGLIGQTTLPDAPIDGLENGYYYYVTRVDANHIRLSESSFAAVASQYKDLSAGGDGIQSLVRPLSAEGVTLRAELSAENKSGAGTQLSDAQQPWSDVVLNGTQSENLLGGLVRGRDMVGSFRNQLTTRFGSRPFYGPQPERARESDLEFAGTIAVNVFNHQVETRIGSTATIQSGADLLVSATIEQAAQVVSISEATRNGTDFDDSSSQNIDGGDYEFSVGVGVGVYVDSAQAIVDPNAVMDASGELSVDAQVAYPLMIESAESVLNPVLAIQESGLEGFDFLLDGTLGFGSNLFNVWVSSLAGDPGSSSADALAIGAAIGWTDHDNDTVARISRGAAINQDPAFQSSSQSVNVLATTEMELVEVGHISAFNLSLPGLLEAGPELLTGNVRGFLQGLINPFGVSAKSAIGPVIIYNDLDNNTVAEIETGDRWDLSSVAIAGDLFELSSDHGWRTGTEVVYETGSNDTAIAGLTPGDVYYVIEDPNDSTRFSLAASLSDAINGTAITLTDGTADGTLVARTRVHTSSSDDGLTVRAKQDVFDIGISQTGANASTLGITASITVGNMLTVTEALIGTDVQITGGDVTVRATDELDRIAIAGAFVLSKQIGVGVSVGINLIDRTTRAAIGDDTDSSDAPSGQGPDEIDISGAVTVKADDSGDIFSLVIAGSIVSSNTDPGTSGGTGGTGGSGGTGGTTTVGGVTVGVGVPLAVNQITTTIEAFVDDPSISADSVTVDAETEVENQAIVIGGALDTSSTSSLNIAATVSVAVNDLTTNVAAFIRDSDVNATGASSGPTVRVSAEDESTILSDGGGVSISLSRGANSGGNNIAVGAQAAVNEIDGTTEAFVDNSTVDATGDMEVTATFSPTIDTLSIGGAGAVSSGSGSTLALSGAGAGSGNYITSTVSAYIDDSAGSSGPGIITRDGGSLTVSADDTSDITADAGAVALSAALSSSSSFINLSVSVGVGINQVTNTIQAYIDDSTVEVAGDLTVEAESVATIDSFTLGGSLSSGALSGAGSGNTITNTILAYIDDGTGTAADPAIEVGGALQVKALDDSTILADAGGFTIAFQLSGSLTGSSITASIGIGAAVNEINNTIQAYVSDTTVSAGSVLVDATSTSNIDSLAMAGSGAGTVSSTSLFTFAGAGAGSGNQVSNLIEASISGNNAETIVDTTSGDVTVSALDDSTITADAGAIALLLGFGRSVGVNVNGSVGVSIAENDIDNGTMAFIEEAEVNSNGNLAVTATTTAVIDALTIAGSGALSVSTGSTGWGISFAGAGTGSGNAVNNITTAAIRDNSNVSTSNGGTVDVIATDDTTIIADAVAGSLDIQVGSGGSVAIGITVAENDIANVTTATIDNSQVDSDGDVTVSGTSTATIDALTVAAALSVDISTSSNSSITLAVGGEAAVSLNDVDNQVRATVVGGSVIQTTSGGSLSVTATDTADILADAGGGSLAVAGSASGFTGSIAISVVLADNDIANTTEATIAGQSVFTGASTASATDLDAGTIGASLAGEFTTAGESLSDEVSVTTITAGSQWLIVDNDTGKRYLVFLDGGSLTAYKQTFVDVAGDVTMDANSTSTIDTYAISVAASVALTNPKQGFALAGAGAGADADNLVENTITVSIDDYSRVEADGSITLSALDESTVISEVPSIAASISEAGVTIAASVSDVAIDNDVDVFVRDSFVKSVGGDVILSTTSNATADADMLVASAGLQLGGTGAGADSESTVAGHANAYLGAGAEVVAESGIVRVAAISDVNATANTEGGGGAVGIEITVMLSYVDVTRSTEAYIGEGASVRAGGVEVDADGTFVADAYQLIVGVGIGASGAGGETLTSIDSDVLAYIGPAGSSNSSLPDTVIESGGNITIDAQSSYAASADTEGGSGGGVAGVGWLQADADITGDTKAYVGHDTSITGFDGAGMPGNLTISSEITGAVADVDILVGGAGLVAGVSGGETETITVDPNSKAYLGDGVYILMGLDGGTPQSIDIDAIGRAEADARVETYAGSILVDAHIPDAIVELKPDVDAYIGSGGDITVSGNVDIDAILDTTPSGDPPTDVIQSLDAVNDSIGFDYELSDGQVVVYANESTSSDIGGLGDGREYDVLNVGDGQIAFGSVFQADDHVDARRDTIDFGTLRQFRSGDAVRYDGGSASIIEDWQLNLSSSDPSYVDPSQIFYIRTIDEQVINSVPIGVQTIKLARSYNEATSSLPQLQESSSIANAINVSGHTFQNGDAVTYRAGESQRFTLDVVDVNVTGSGSNAAPDGVNTSANNILLPNHGFESGDAVTYRLQGPNYPIPELTADATYYVIKLSDDEIQLAATRENSLTDRGTLTTNDDGPVVPISISRDSAGDAKRTIHTIERNVDGLETGVTYYVTEFNASTGDFKLLANRDDTTPITLDFANRSGPHYIGAEGIDLVPYSGGDAAEANQRILRDLTGSLSGTHRLNGPGGIDLSQVAAPSGDGISSSTVIGGGGALAVSGGGVTSKLEEDSTVDAYVGSQTTIVAGGDVSIKGTIEQSVTTNVDNKAGALIQVGVVRTRANQEGSVDAYLDDGAVIEADGNVTIVSKSDTTNSVVAYAGGGGAIGAAVADTEATSDVDTKTWVGEGAEIHAGGHVQIHADSSNDTSTDSDAFVIAVGAGADADDVDGGDYDDNVDIDVLTQVEIKGEAKVTGSTVDLDAKVTRIRGEATANAEAYSPILLGVTSAFADAKVNIDADAKTLIRGGTSSNRTYIQGTEGVDVQARFVDVDAIRNTDAIAVGLIPPQGESEQGDSNLSSLVDADTEVFVIAGPRLTDSSTLADSQLKSTASFTHLALYGQAAIDSFTAKVDDEADNSSDTGSRTRDIIWDADVDITSGANPELIVDASGNIVSAVNVSVNDTGNSARTSGTISEDDIIVNDIVNNDAGEVWFDAETGEIDGSNSTFRMLETFGDVTILNSSDKDLVINKIDVITTDLTSADLRPFIELDASNVNINFALSREVEPTTVRIENFGSGDIGLNDLINNPIGDTLIVNLGGDIINGDQVSSFNSDSNGFTPGNGTIRTNEIEIESVVGDIGSGDSERIDIELIQSHQRAESFEAIADGDIWLDITGIHRILSSDPSVGHVTIVLDEINAGNHADVKLRGTKVETSSEARDSVYVNAPYDSSSAPDGYFDTYYHPDGSSTPTRDAGVVDTGTSAEVEGTYRFDLIKSGSVVDLGSINIFSTKTGAANFTRSNMVNVDAETNVVDIGHVDVRTNGLVDVEERSGSLRVGEIVSLHEDVTLISPSAIVDKPIGSADPTLVDDPNPDVVGRNVTMTAGTKVGSSSNFLEIDSSLVSFGVLNVDAPEGAYLDERNGDLNIDTIDAHDGDASVVTQTGSILDARNAGSGDSGWNIQAVHVDLHAVGGGIGGSGNDLEIDTDAGQSGRLYADASDDVYLEEVSDSLDVLMVESFTGLVRLTVRESSATNEDLTLLTAGSNLIVEDAPAAISRGRIAAAESIELRVGDDITQPTNSEILSGLVDANSGIILRGDYTEGDADHGTNILLQGTVIPGSNALTEIFGDVDEDFIHFDQTTLGGVTRAYGSNSSAVPSDATVDDGEDHFLVDRLQSMDVASLHTLTIDGQADTDRYEVKTTGSRGLVRDYVINVLDSGAKDDGADTLEVFGFDSTVNGLDQNNAAPSDDVFLLRRTSYIPGKFGNEVTESPAFVALLHGTIDQARLAGADGDEAAERPQEVQRINYDANINGRMKVNGMGGNDWFAVDDNSAISTLDGGLGNDNFQIGQIYGSLRIPDNVREADQFPTVATTRGYISPGISEPLLAQGGSGDDSFSVYSNQAELRLEGDSGNDLFVVRAFALAQVDPTTGEILTDEDGVAIPDLTSFSTQEDTQIKPGDGDDSVQYNVNAPVSIDGGSGFDKVLVLGTEFPDNFVISSEGIFGAGLTIRYDNIEVVEVDGLEGDDDFFVISTPFGVSTRVIGGLGSDHISVAGDASDRIVSRQLEGSSASITHEVATGSTSYANGISYANVVARGVDLNVASDDQGVVIIEEQGGTEVREGSVGNTDTYTVKLATAPEAGTFVYVNVSAARSPLDEEEQGGETITVAVDVDGDGQLDGPARLRVVPNEPAAYTRLIYDDGTPTYVRNRAVVLRFDSTNWDQSQTIYVRSVSDGFAEGNRVTTISHSVQVNAAASDADRERFDGADVRNVEVSVIDQDSPGIVIQQSDGNTTVLEGSLTPASGYTKGVADSYTVQLSKAPVGTVTIDFAFDDSQLTLDSSIGSRFSVSGGIASLIFDGTNWSIPVTIDVEAVDDVDPEDPKATVITHSVNDASSGRDSSFDSLVEQLDVELLDDDGAGVLVVESDGTTLVSKDGTTVTDTYTVRLVSQPNTDVTITIETDGQAVATPQTLTFTDSNWWIPQTVDVVGDPSFVPIPGTEFDREFNENPHLLSELRGPLAIEGGSIGPRALVAAILLPQEDNQGLLEIGEQPPEVEEIDVVNIYDDASIEDKSGTLTSNRLTGLNLPQDLTFADGTAFGEPATIPGGISFGQITVDSNGNILSDSSRSTIEVLNLMLGSGNDQLTVSGTLLAAEEGSAGPASHGTLTIVHGGGNRALPNGTMGGDRITVTGGGGPGSPLVIFGDTSQDGLWYSGSTTETNRDDNSYFGLKLHDQVGTADDAFRYGRGAPFANNGDDTIDASALTAANMVPLGSIVSVGVTIYGGPGNDTILGSQAGDHLAGGSGDDWISGQAGVDHIYGDSGFNLDPITRTLFVVTADAGANPSAFAPRDALVAGKDTIHGNEGDDVLFGDHGVVDQDVAPGTVYPDHLTGTRTAVIDVVDNRFGSAVNITYADASEKLLTTGRILELQSVRPLNGDDDDIGGGSGRDRILGGNGQDQIRGGADPDVIFGDHGLVSYIAPDYYGNADTDRSTLDEIKSIHTAAQYGDADSIFDDSSDDIILAGQGGDTIDAGAGQNIVFGDHGRLLGVDTGVNRPVADPEPAKVDDDYQMQTLGLVEAIAFDDDTRGGADWITTGIGRDMIFGGQAGDTINAFASDGGIAADDGNNIVFGDFGLVDYLAEELADSTQIPRTDDIDRIWSIALATRYGGNDSIITGDRNDIVLGGTGDDMIGVGGGQNLAFGDNAILTAAPRDHRPSDPPLLFSVHEFLVCSMETIGFEDSDGGTDTLMGSPLNDVLFGGGGADIIYAGAGDDLVFGDQGRIECKNDHPFDPTTSLPPICWDEFPEDGFLSFEAINVDQSSGSGDDLIYGQDGRDVLMGQQGDDVLYGGNGDDIVIGGSNVAGALDGDDRLDGGAGHDVVAGDNAEICYRPDDLDPRMRALVGNQLYGTTPGSDDGEALVVGLVDHQPIYFDPRDHSQYRVKILDHSDEIQSDHPEWFGNDYIAGGAGEDELFGQLGDDIIQGDGKIGTDPRADLAKVANDGPPTEFNAYRDGSTNGASSLVVIASFESSTDGDDYIEGNGGDDVIFGNLGQDDILGGSSDLYSLSAPTDRPDGSDLIFGGAGIDIARNDYGDATVSTDGVVTVLPSGHASDADSILGDNGRILRIVGVGGNQVGVQQTLAAEGIPASGGFLNYHYDVEPADNDLTTYDRVIVRAVQHLDYTPGGVLYDSGAANDRGAGDEIHGESGDDAIHGQVGNDVLFGDGQDDDLIGGYGNDWISGGTGDDGVLGDDGRIMTSRNSTVGEPLYGIAGLLANDPEPKYSNGNVLDEFIKTPGSIQQATINVSGELKKSVNLVPFSVDPDWIGQYDEFVSSGPKQNDPFLFTDEAHYSDDILFGGLGDDVAHGGSGDDAISGGEALPESYTQVYDASGLLIGLARSDFGHPLNVGDTLRFNPEDPDGWHRDRTRRAGEFALYDEYDPRRKILLKSDGTAAKDDSGVEWFLNFSTTEGIHRPAGTIAKATGQFTSEYAEAWDDGSDALFGDLGNDWIVGGTGRDNLYGGFGNDLMNADDDHATDDPDVEGAYDNEAPDTQPSFEDRAYGGAGRDILIGNTGGDRLIDWVGEFNSYLVPFATFGMATVSRTLQPQLAEFLYALSAADGADPTRGTDAGNVERNGEPEGELGMIRQQDFGWQDQTGAPTDPQAGNIPGGKRDVLRTSGFNDGSMQGFAPDSGIWEVAEGQLQVSAASSGSDAVTVVPLDTSLPNYFEVQATVRAEKPTAGWKANGFIIFDYYAENDFKFAGIDVSNNKMVMGHRDHLGWHIDAQASVRGGVKHSRNYNLLLAINGVTATLLLDNATLFTHVYPIREIDGLAFGLNNGMVGVGSDRARGAFDNISVNVLPPTIEWESVEQFQDGSIGLLRGETAGDWSVQTGRLVGTPVESGIASRTVEFDGGQSLPSQAYLEVDAVVVAQSTGGLIFDHYAANDFKFAAIDAQSQRLLIGHVTDRSGWVVDQSVAMDVVPDQDHSLKLTIKGTTVSVYVDQSLITSFAYNGPLADGAVGVLARDGSASFAEYRIRTDYDLALQQAAADSLDVNADGAVTALDALLVVNSLSSESMAEGEFVASAVARYDVNGDSRVTALDALKIINHLNRLQDASVLSLVGTQSGGAVASGALADDTTDDEELVTLLAEDVSRQLF